MTQINNNTIFDLQPTGIAEAQEYLNNTKAEPVKTVYTPRETANAAPTTTPAQTPAPASAKQDKPAVATAAAIPEILKNKGLDVGFFMQPKRAFLAAGGTEVEFAREINFAMQHLMRNEFLIDCAKDNPEFFIEAIKSVPMTGLSLNPELKLAYLVPRKRKIYFQSSYMGKREIIMRASIVQWIEANLVYDGDFFEVRKGSVNELIHKPDYFSTNRTRDKIKGGYWTAVLTNGQSIFDVVPVARIEEIRKRSEVVKAGKTTPWDSDYNEMARKTIINAAFSQLPKTGISEHILRAIEVMQQADNEEFEAWKETQQQQRTDKFSEDGKFTPYEEVK